MRAFDIELPRLHTGQVEVDRSPARFKVLACGRRWGKTRYATHKCLRVALAGGVAWWVAPSFPVATVGWRGLKALARQIPETDKNEVEKSITLPTGGMIQVKSADNPDSLRGVGLDFVAIDEAAFIKEEAWTAALRPALSDKLGSALIISTPKGRNWFYHAFHKGQDTLGNPDWHSWSFPTVSNPYISPEEVEAARLELPEATFEQEYLAVFLENAGAVFRNLAACLNAPSPNPADHEGHRIVAGIDWGRQSDFTAISIGCTDCRIELELDRFNQIDYHYQRQRLGARLDYWHVQTALAEHNSMGDPIITEMQREGMPVVPFDTTANSKPPLIENMALAFERTEWQFLPDAVGRLELEAYARTISPVTGRSSYSAPSGGHDDTVMARALMLWQSGRATPMIAQPVQRNKFEPDYTYTEQRWKL